jgi:hypothetical protein
MSTANGIQPTIQQNLTVQIVSPNGSFAAVPSASQVLAIAPNAARRGVVFINPSSQVTIYVVPSNQIAVQGQGIPILPQGQVEFIGDPRRNINYNCGWNAIASGSGSNNPLEILELL